MTRGFRYDFTILNNVVKALGDKSVVRVGVLSSKKNAPRMLAGRVNPKTGRRTKGRGQDSSDNAYIGRLHEFGSFERHIPARSWLRMPLTLKRNEIIQKAGQGADKLIAQGKMNVLKKRIGIACEAVIQAGFETHGFGTWAENKPSTVRRKGSSSPLIDTGQLRRSISSEVIER